MSLNGSNLCCQYCGARFSSIKDWLVHDQGHQDTMAQPQNQSNFVLLTPSGPNDDMQTSRLQFYSVADKHQPAAALAQNSPLQTQQTVSYSQQTQQTQQTLSYAQQTQQTLSYAQPNSAPTLGMNPPRRQTRSIINQRDAAVGNMPTSNQREQIGVRPPNPNYYRGARPIVFSTVQDQPARVHPSNSSSQIPGGLIQPSQIQAGNNQLAGLPIVIAPELNFACSFCSEAFESQGELDLHKTYAHSAELEASVFPCPTCNRSFRQKDHLDEHMKSHAPSMEICSVCREPFRDQQELVVHMRERHETASEANKPFVCMYCKLRYAKRQELLAHLSLEHPEDGHKCDVCERKFQSKNELVTHMRSHAAPPPVTTTNVQLTSQVQGLTPATINRESIIAALLHEPRTSTQSAPGAGASIRTSYPYTVSATPAGQVRQPTVPSQRMTRPLLLNSSQTIMVPVTVSPTLIQQTARIGLPLSMVTQPSNPAQPLSNIGSSPSRRYKCEVCSLVFESDGDLRTHKETHVARGASFKAGPTASSKDCQITHVATHVSKVMSSESGTKVPPPASPPLPIQQIRPPSPKIPLTCNVCLQDFETEDVLTAHLEGHIQQGESLRADAPEGKETHRCYMCMKDEVFQTRKELLDHLELHASGALAPHYNPKSMSCNHCTLNFKSKDELETHKLLKHNESGDAKRSTANLIPTKSQPYNPNARPYCCRLCRSRFLTEQDLEDHQRRLHDLHYKKKTARKSPAESGTSAATRNQSKELKAQSSDDVISLDDDDDDEGTPMPNSLTRQNITASQKETIRRNPSRSARPLHSLPDTGETAITISLSDEEATTEFNTEVQNTSKPPGTQKELKCSICSKEFVFRASLDLHLKTAHKEEDLISCHICGEKYSQVKDLEEHMKKHKNGGATVKNTSINTKVQSKSSNVQSNSGPNKSSKDAVLRKKARDTPEEWKCKICRMKLGSKTELNRHLHEHEVHVTIKTGEVDCSLCGQKFQNGLDLKIHVVEKEHRNPNQDKQYGCDFCKENCRSTNELYVHLKTHYEHDFECYICKQTLKGLPKISEHLMREHGELYLCKVCGKVFTEEADIRRELRRHKLKLRLVNSGNFECDYCGKAYDNELILQKHAIAHKHMERNKEGKFECAFCDKSYKEPVRLHAHLSIHLHELIECYICGAEFKGIIPFNRHLVHKHNEHMNPICEFCNKTTKSKQDLRSFKQLPYDSNLYQCSKCDKVYKSQELQTIHKNCGFKMIQYKLGMCATESTVCFDYELAKKPTKVIDLTDVESAAHATNKSDDQKGVKDSTATDKSSPNTRVIETDDLESQFQKSTLLPGPAVEVDITDDAQGDPKSAGFRTSKEQASSTNSVDKKEGERSLLTPSVLAKARKMMSDYENDIVEVLDDDIVITESGEESKAAASLTTASQMNQGRSDSQDEQQQVPTNHTDMEEDAEERSILCEECGQEIFSSAQYKDHMGLHEESGSMLCTLCGLVFEDQVSGYLHKLREHPEEDPVDWLKDLGLTTVICLICRKSFRAAEELGDHVREHTGDTCGDDDRTSKEDPPSTAEVKKVETSAPEKGDHSRNAEATTGYPRLEDITAKHTLPNVGSSDKYACKRCTQTFRKKKELKSHFISCHKRKCDLCSKVFATPLRLSIHQRTRHSSMVCTASFRCSFCSQTFSCRTQLDKHKEFAHGTIFKKIVKCHNCRKKFKTNELLLKHVKCVHKPDKIQCQTCKCFIKVYMIKYHKTKVNCFLGF